VSKQDSQFFNIFSLVLGILVAITLVLFGVARAVGKTTQNEHVLTDPRYLAEVAERTAWKGQVAVAGQDNSALVIVASDDARSVRPAAALPETGADLYQVACATCHSAGIAGAPKSGDRAAWAPRLAKGSATLYKHAIEGFTGEGGVMPARGGRADLPDDLVKLGVDYMMELNR